MWKIVGGSGKGGLLVRTGEDLTSAPRTGRLATGTLVEEIQRKGSRLHFRLFSGLGPWEGWITLTLHEKVLAEKVDLKDTTTTSLEVVVDCRDSRWFRCWVPSTTTLGQLKDILRGEETWPKDAVLETDAKDSDLVPSPLSLAPPRLSAAALCAALAPEAAEAAANAALAAAQGLAKALLLWRWQRLQMALEEMETRKESSELLALQIALGRWPEALALAKTLQLPEAQQVVEAWQSNDSPGRFSPSPALFEGTPMDEVMPGVRQIDGLIPIEDGVSLGIRLLLQVRNDHPETSRPLVLYFHGNAETVDTYLEPEVFHPLQASNVSAVVADFRGYGYSTGRPSLATIATDGERVVDALPNFLGQHQLPWPWPGGVYLLGRSMGGLVACHLAALKGRLFEGVILESTFCGSYAPGALPPEEPPKEGALGTVEPRFWSAELQEAVDRATQLCRKLVKPGMEELALEGSPDFVHLMASEDKLRAFSGRLLILHGEIDTIIPVSHARRLCDAATFATRRLVTVNKGHNDISNSAKYVTALKKFLDGG